MIKVEIEKYLNKKIAVFFDKTKVDTNGSKYYTGELVKLTDNTLTLSLHGCSYATEVCIGLDVIAFVSLSK